MSEQVLSQEIAAKVQIIGTELRELFDLYPRHIQNIAAFAGSDVMQSGGTFEQSPRDITLASLESTFTEFRQYEAAREQIAPVLANIVKNGAVPIPDADMPVGFLHGFILEEAGPENPRAFTVLVDTLENPFRYPLLLLNTRPQHSAEDAGRLIRLAEEAGAPVPEHAKRTPIPDGSASAVFLAEKQAGTGRWIAQHSVHRNTIIELFEEGNQEPVWKSAKENTTP